MTRPADFGMADFVVDDALLALKERKRLLDDVWLLALLVLFLAIGVPWYLRILEINFAPVAWSLFGFAALYFITTQVTDSLRSRRGVMLGMFLLQLAGVLLLGLIWHWTGSLQNPMFLLVFVLPVAACTFVLVSWQSYATVLLSVVAVTTVALINAPELRWYLTQAGSLPHWVTQLLPERSATFVQPFPSLHAPPTYSVLLLASFTALLFTVALMTETVTSLLQRLYQRLESSVHALNAAEELSFEVLRASQLPAALLYADTLHIAQVSESFLDQLFLNADSLSHYRILDVVRFAYPEIIADLLAGNGGEVAPAIFYAEAEPRVARVRAVPIRFGGRSYIYFSIEDISDQQVMETALNTLDNAVVVVSGSKHVLCFNPAAKALFRKLDVGIEAAVCLRQEGLPEGWWETGLRARLERTIEIESKRWVATCSSERILGEKDALTIVALRPGGER
jgi:hypothetical protein